MLITPEYSEQLKYWHDDRKAFGSGGASTFKVVEDLAKLLNTTDVLDYGCGKRYLAMALPFPIQNYDPGVKGMDTPPVPADIVVSHHVLEHIEPECLDDVLKDMLRCTKKVCLVWVPVYAALGFLPDGRNAHLIQRTPQWWQRKFSEYFDIRYIVEQTDDRDNAYKNYPDIVVHAVLQPYVKPQ